MLPAVQETSGSLDEAFDAAKNFNVAYGRVLLKREKSALERKVSNSGLHMPDNVKDQYKSSEGYVIKCGENADDYAKSLVGKRVLFARYSGDDIVINEQEFVLAMDEDIFGDYT